MHAVTITGWVAFVCVGSLVVVVASMAGFALWRWALAARRRHRYTPVAPDTELKEGDV
mgnify:CR=1 FL=1